MGLGCQRPQLKALTQAAGQAHMPPCSRQALRPGKGGEGQLLHAEPSPGSTHEGGITKATAVVTAITRSRPDSPIRTRHPERFWSCLHVRVSRGPGLGSWLPAPYPSVQTRGAPAACSVHKATLLPQGLSFLFLVMTDLAMGLIKSEQMQEGWRHQFLSHGGQRGMS